MKNKRIIYKLIIIVIIILFFFLIYAIFKQKSALQVAIGSSYRQTIKIERLLEQNNISYKTINISTRKGLSQDIDAYDLIDTNNEQYLLILAHNNKSLIAILNSENELIFGIIDSNLGIGDLS